MIWLVWACQSPEPEKQSQPQDTTISGTESEAMRIVDELRADRDGTLLLYNHLQGWPIKVEEGYLVVSTDPRLNNVAGDFDAWAGQPLTQEDDFLWAVVPAQPNDHYKLTDRDQRWEADPWAQSFEYDEFGEISLIAPKGAHLERFIGFGSETLAERNLRVWVPADPPDRVLYMHDGQNLFDPEAIWGGWRLQGQIPAGMLVVGIDNTPARMDEYTHVRDDIGGVYGGLADEYADLINNDIRPFIVSHYGDVGPVGTLGSSLGGLISLYLAHLDPQAWDYAASLSGTVGWGSIGLHEPTIIELMAEDGHQPVPIYIDSGGNGTTCADSDQDGIHDDDPNSSDNYCENIQLRDTLIAAGYHYDQDLWHWWEPDANHDEMAWSARVALPLEIFAGL